MTHNDDDCDDCGKFLFTILYAACRAAPRQFSVSWLPLKSSGRSVLHLIDLMMWVEISICEHALAYDHDDDLMMMMMTTERSPVSMLTT